MFIFQIREHLLQRGIKPTVTAFMRMGIAQRSAYNLLNGKAKSISLDHLGKICFYLNCTPKELLRYDIAKDDQSVNTHPLKEWTKRPTAFPLQEFQDMNPDQIEASQAAIRRILDGETE